MMQNLLVNQFLCRCSSEPKGEDSTAPFEFNNPHSTSASKLAVRVVSTVRSENDMACQIQVV